MKYYIVKFDRDSGNGSIWKEIERRDLKAQNLKDAKKEAEEIKDECGFQNITVVLYNEKLKQLAKFAAYKITYL